MLDWHPQSGSQLYAAKQTAQQRSIWLRSADGRLGPTSSPYKRFLSRRHLVLYMQSLAESSSSKSAIEEAYNAISWVHAMANYDSPTESQFVRTVMQGLQRNLAKPVTKKLPVTTDMLGAVVDDAGKSKSS